MINLFYLACLLTAISSNCLFSREKELIEKPLFIVVSSYNNACWVQQNLDSIFFQAYSNYRVIYVDDCSSDGTVDLVRQYIKEHNLEDKVTLIVNDEREWKLINLYRVYYLAHDWEIIVQVDGDDILSHPQVFKKINQAFTHNNAWITYGGFQRVSKKEGSLTNEVKAIGPVEPIYTIPKKVIQDNSFRSWGWIFTHIHAFYAWLFKCIKLEDFITKNVTGFEGKLFPFANDQAMVYPMLEMATGAHIFRFTEKMYLGTVPEKRGNDKKIDWAPVSKQCVDEVRKGFKYSPLQSPLLRNLENYKQEHASLIVVCNGEIPSLEFFESLALVRGLNAIHVVGFDLDESAREILSLVAFAYAKVHCFDLENHDDMRQFKRALAYTNYLVLSDGSSSFDKSIDIGQSIYTLEKTFAYAFYLDRNLQKYPADIHAVRVEDATYCWKFVFSKKEWRQYNSMKNVLYRKKDILSFIDSFITKNFNSLNSWQHANVHENRIGLFFGN